MKLGQKEAIAVVVALVVVAGFFFLINRPTSIDIVGENAKDNVGAPFAGFEQLVKQGAEGLIAEDLLVGDGKTAEKGSKLTVHYVGILTDGTQFDSSVERGEPFSFTLGAGAVIDGWDQGLVGMKEGGRRVLVIPPELGYGSSGVGSIPPDSTLIFEVLLLGVE